MFRKETEVNDYHLLQRERRMLADLYKFCKREGMTDGGWREMLGERAYGYLRSEWSVAASATTARRRIRDGREKSRLASKPSMKGWADQAKSTFGRHLRYVRPTLRLAEDTVVVTLTPPREGYHRGVYRNPHARLYEGEFYISPAWKLLPGWEKSFPALVMVYAQRIGPEMHRVKAVEFLPGNETRLHDLFVVNDPLTKALYKGKTVELALCARDRARASAVLESL